MKFVENYPDDFRYTHWCSRIVVSRDSFQTSEYRLALRQAEAACPAEPGNTAYLTTLGLAQYRLGMLSESLSTLTRANSNNVTATDPVNLAVLALASFRLGQKVEARKRLHELREFLKSPNRVENSEAERLLGEAKRLIEPTE